MTSTATALQPPDLLALHERFPDRYPVLLESPSGQGPLGEQDLLMALPAERLTRLPTGELEMPDGSRLQARFLDTLDQWFAREQTARQVGKVFEGGWFLYLGYELADEVEPTVHLPPPRFPSAIAWRMRGAIHFDRLSGAVRLSAESEELLERLVVELAADLRVLQLEAAGSHGQSGSTPTHSPIAPESLHEQPGPIFIDGVASALEAIRRGDIYQANLSRPWAATLQPEASIADLYRALRASNPAPFAGSARMHGFAVLSSSPERLIRVSDGLVSTRPIAGTRPRGRDAVSDARLAGELLLNEKERAEHVMLVDLERNDLGRICRAGSVNVDEYMTIETYATVHHIVSNIRGEIRADVTPGQAIAAVFPGGTITGCPKVRCMQLLAAFEQTPRDAYTGSMGYLGRDGTMDLNILIRTLLVHDGSVEFRTGAGIVADSVPESELAETRAKAQGMLRAMGVVE